MVGDRGASVVFRGQSYLAQNMFTGATEQRPSGGYFLLYWVIDGSYMTEPGRYYPDQHIACLSWVRPRIGDCYSVDEAAAAQLGSVAVPRLQKQQTYLVRLAFRRRDARLDANGAVAIEYAFNRRGQSVRAPRPLRCTSARAWWKGAAAASRPTRMCVARSGVWTNGRLYRVAGAWRAL